MINNEKENGLLANDRQCPLGQEEDFLGSESCENWTMMAL
jgi:hypothetical protein